jgi:hypothetical protein
VASCCDTAMNFRVYRMQGVFALAEEMLASQKGFSFVDFLCSLVS